MHTDLTISESAAKTPANAVIIALSVITLTTTFYFIEHRNWETSSLEAFRGTEAEVVEKAAEGDPERRLAITAIGAFGALMLVRRDGRRLHLRSALALSLAAYVGWCVMSVYWSTDLPITARHVTVLLFCTVGALGLARQLTPRDLCIVALAVCTILCLNSVLTEIVLGTFRPWSSEYRFAGTLHPNVQAPYCALMALSALCLAYSAQRGRQLLWLLFFVGLALLVLTKSRTVCAIFILGLLGYAVLRSPGRSVFLGGACTAVVICTLIFGAALAGSDLQHQAATIGMIGRDEDFGVLSGRAPLWAELWPHLQERFLLGNGYETFWNPQRIDSISHNVEWAVTDGHSAYLDAALDLGIIGALLCVTITVLGVVEARRRYLISAQSGYLFLLALIGGRALNAISESDFPKPATFVSFVMLCGLIQLGVCQSTDVSQSHNKDFA